MMLRMMIAEISCVYYTFLMMHDIIEIIRSCWRITTMYIASILVFAAIFAFAGILVFAAIFAFAAGMLPGWACEGPSCKRSSATAKLTYPCGFSHFPIREPSLPLACSAYQAFFPGSHTNSGSSSSKWPSSNCGCILASTLNCNVSGL